MKLHGIIKVNPERPSDFRKTHKLSTVVLEIPCKALPLFYIDLLQREFGPWLRLAPPMFGLHVTIVKGTETFNKNKAMRFHNHKITLMADPSTLARTEWSLDQPGFWCIGVAEPEVKKLRTSFRVKTDAYGLIPHITVAREQATFMKAKPMTDAEAYQALLRSIELVPTKFQHKGGNFTLLGDLKRLQFIPALINRESVMQTVYKHLSVPVERDNFYLGFNTRWEHDIVRLFGEQHGNN